MKLRPRRLVHRGTVEASALYFHTSLRPPHQVKQWVLSRWRPGATLYAMEDGYLYRLPQPQWLSCAAAPGLPLVQMNGWLTAVPLEPTEWRALAGEVPGVLWARGGRLQRAELPTSSEDLSKWLDVSGLEVVEVRTLGEEPAPVPVLQATSLNMRERVGIPAAPGLIGTMNALQAARFFQVGPGAGAAAVGGLAMGVAGALGWLARLFGAAGGGGERSGSPGGMGGATGVPAPSGGALRNLLARALMKSGLFFLIGRRQAKYVSQLMDMFDDNDLEQALRHAIPLAGPASALAGGPMFGLPSAREQLSLSMHRTGSSGGLFMGEGLYEELKKRYRAAYERLAQQGRIEEAAFVLAELLEAHEEAVAFLEKHGRHQLAAELAEGRGLAPDLVVRQWFLAGNAERAVAIGRRAGAFAGAVAHLERTQPGQAERLRLLWADSLADSGDYVGAVNAAWPVESARALLKRWIEAGMENPHPASAALFVRRLMLEPEAFEEVRDSVLPRLEDEVPEAVPWRHAFAKALTQTEGRSAPVQAMQQVLALPTARALLRDRVRHPNVGGQLTARDLAALSQDGAFRADLPPARELPAAVAPPSVLWVAEGDRGALPVSDAAPLPGGRVLLALGEAGVRLLSARGKTLFHLDAPAARLVVSRHGDRALAVAARGEISLVTRLDLQRRTASRWVELRVDAFCPEYDGSLWFVGTGDHLQALDVLADTPRALWHVPQLGGAVRAMASTATVLSCLVENPAADPRFVQWNYELPGLALRRRAQFNLSSGPAVATAEPVVPLSFAVAPGDNPLVLSAPSAGQVSLHELHRGRMNSLSGAHCGTPVLDAERMAVPVRSLDAVRVYLLPRRESGLPSTRLDFPLATQVSLRLSGDILTAATDAGQVVVVDWKRLYVLNNLVSR